ncbi:MAG: glycosyltransferase [Saprospiraceae bacterium]|nr:glycosyltransferase [Saprospiraceae bacterium]
MKILIVTAWYKPFIHPRAHRWAALAEHWASKGHEVHVLTARVRDHSKSGVMQGVHIHRGGFDSLKEWVYYWFGSRQARGRVGLKPGKPSLATRLAAWIYTSIWKNLFFPDDACVWYFPAKRKMRQLLENEHFDAVITVSLPFTGHLVGLLTFRKFQTFGKLKPFWLADIGDPFSFQAKSPNNAFFYQKKNSRIERKILESADALTVTTEATLRKYSEQFGEKSVEKMFVVPPLITNHQSTTPPITPPSPRLRRINKIGYFGSLYAPTRTPDAFLDLLAQTFAQRPDLRGRLEVHFYGEVFPAFFEKLSAERCIQLHGLCSRAEVWAAMKEMDVLLNIGNTTDFQLPSKAVDYLAAGKPVLNLSYVENDPFAAFFERISATKLRSEAAYSENKTEQVSGVLNLHLSNGKVGDGELHRWLEWLESDKPALGSAEIAERVAPFLVGNIARQYFRLIESNGVSPTPLG